MDCYKYFGMFGQSRGSVDLLMIEVFVRVSESLNMYQGLISAVNFTT